MSSTKELSQELINEFVTEAHRSLSKVEEMLNIEPKLLHSNAVWNETALEAASHMAHVDIIEFLLVKGAESDIFAATILGQNDTVRQFLVNQPKLIEATGAHGIPLFYYPAIADNREVGELFLSKGTDVNVGSGGLTALHGVTLKGHIDYAQWLITQGADIHVKNYQGETPLKIALDNGHDQIADLLRHNGATE
jgi:ankyrin repeat protein